MADKESLFIEWLNNQSNYYKKRFLEKSLFTDELKRDLFKNIIFYFHKHGWIRSYENAKVNYDYYFNKANRLDINLHHIWKQVKDKMWSLERKYG